MIKVIDGQTSSEIHVENKSWSRVVKEFFIDEEKYWFRFQKGTIFKIGKNIREQDELVGGWENRPDAFELTVYDPF